jgi:hypothetical protein
VKPAKVKTATGLRKVLLEISMLRHAEYYGDHVVGHDERNCAPCMAIKAIGRCPETTLKDGPLGEFLLVHCVAATGHEKGKHRWRERYA